jgi:Tol biopolymer transport system component
VRFIAACAVALAAAAVATSSAAVQLPSFAIDPTWSPNGKWIAFVDARPGGGNLSDLYVMNADGTNIRRLTDGRHVRQPSWSPDSKRIAVGSGGDSIAVINANGTGLHEIAHGGFGPSWSPGGRKIAFSSLGSDERPPNVYVVNPDGTNRTLVAAFHENECPAVYPTWSPDGQRIAFGLTGGCGTIGMVTSYGGRIRQLAGGDFTADLDWSPGGRRIAYTALNGVSPHDTVDILDLKTGHHNTLHTGSHPSWSPNSRRLVFSDSNAVYVMSADGTEVSKLVPR